VGGFVEWRTQGGKPGRFEVPGVTATPPRGSDPGRGECLGKHRALLRGQRRDSGDVEVVTKPPQEGGQIIVQAITTGAAPALPVRSELRASADRVMAPPATAGPSSGDVTASSTHAGVLHVVAAAPTKPARTASVAARWSARRRVRG